MKEAMAWWQYATNVVVNEEWLLILNKKEFGNGEIVLIFG
jgi:hypothetical protein